MKKLLAGLGVGALAALTIAAPAMAAGTEFTGDDASLTVVKYRYDSEVTWDPATATGEQLTPPDGAIAVPGVGFTLCKINDLESTPGSDWGAIDELSKQVASGDAVITDNTIKLKDDGGTYTCDPGQQELTGSDGAVTFTGLNGIYLVQETGSLPGTVEAAVPFVVAAPLPSSDGTWNYKVYAYPKNAISEITKKLTAISGVPGKTDSTYTWEIQAVVPQVRDNDVIKRIDIYDPIDANFTLNEDSVVVKVGDAVVTTGYSSTYADAVNGVRLLTITSATPSLIAGPGQTITVTFTTKLTGTEFDPVDKPLVNNAWLSINGDGQGPTDTDAGTSGTPGEPLEPGDGTPKMFTGTVTITKIDADKNDQLLEGAVFYVFDNETAAQACAETLASTECGSAQQTLSATDDQGEVISSSIFIGSEVGAKRTVYLVEKAAPSGYVLDSKPIEVELTATAGENGAPALANAAKTVENSPIPDATLPQTGAAGVKILLIVAAAVGVSGLILMGVSSRRKTAGKATK